VAVAVAAKPLLLYSPLQRFLLAVAQVVAPVAGQQVVPLLDQVQRTLMPVEVR
jgi:hypothetical protein